MKDIVPFRLFEQKSSIGFFTNIEKDTITNNNYRKVLFTTKNIQLVLMSLKKDEDIGEEIHNNDQFFRFEKGEGLVIIEKENYKVKDGDCVIIPAGKKHNIINIGEKELKLYTIYSPPHHKDGLVSKNK